jgi:Mitochondrial ATP synthase B chain precursor (ATP-synt_B)
MLSTSPNSFSRSRRYARRGDRSRKIDANDVKETAKLESQAFELEQKTALAAEAKTVLDSWVRYEGQVKARQQKELADTIIAKIGKELENPKVLQQILQQSVADVESMSFKASLVRLGVTNHFLGVVASKAQ